MPVEPLELALLCAAALFAGVIDAIAGGGGLLTLPSLLAVGLPPHLALGTNKGQSVFGSSAALFRYWRAGMLHAERGRYSFPAGFIGALLGAYLLLLVSPAVLRPLVIFLLVGVAIFLTFRRNPDPAVLRVALSRRGAILTAVAIAFVIGTYDGFFGPGTGTFLIMAYGVFLGTPLAKASADAKVVNFASNLASVLLFASRGVVLWEIALPMAVAQAIGGFVGAHLTVKGGDRLVRPVVLAVVVALVTKLAYDFFRG